MAPALNAISRPPASDEIAACAVRTLARTETFMPMKPASAREDGADGEADADQPAEDNADDQEDHDADDADGGVLPPQIGLRALAHRRGNFLHPGAAGIRRHHRLGRPDGVPDARKPAQDDDHQSYHGGPTPVGDARTAPLPGEIRFDGNTARSRLKSARTMPKSPRAGNALIGGLVEGFWAVFRPRGRPLAGGI